MTFPRRKSAGTLFCAVGQAFLSVSKNPAGTFFFLRVSRKADKPQSFCYGRSDTPVAFGVQTDLSGDEGLR